MDGDGQSMLAIMQSLRDAGLLVTLVDGKQAGNSTTAFLAINTCRPQERRSLGINTKLRSIHHSSTQANDARYASVYQLAHCGVKPSSPPVHVPEFPPQRAAPHLTEGNFEVRGWRSSQCQYTPVRSSHSCRGNLHWSNRGSPYQWTKDTSDFAHSLRKYPNLSPNRSLSTELVQKLLTYTQAKNFPKSSSHTHNVRAAKTSPNTISECIEKTSKDVQTYTKTKHDKNDKANNTYEIKYQKKQNYPAEKSRHSLKDKHQIYTYDYLKKTKPRGWNSRGTEVRYLTDVTKCIKDAIRNICDEPPMMCPNVQSRFSHHRRLHHCQKNGQPSSSTYNDGNLEGSLPTGSRACGVPRCPSPDKICPRIRPRYSQYTGQRHLGHKSCSSLNHMEVQVSPPPELREASVMTRCESPISMSHTCPAVVKTCCFCKKPLPCQCRSETDRKIEKEVLDWIKEIPVYSDDTTDNKCLRHMLSRRLIDALQKIIKDNDFEKIRGEIDKCLNVLPMWCPENEEDKTMFKNQLAENLMNRLKQFTEKDFFKEQILMWYEELPFKNNIKEDKHKFIDNLLNRLKSVGKLPNNRDYKEALKNEIQTVLNEIPGIDKDVILRMANKLADNLVPDDKKSTIDDNEIRYKICEWIDNTPEFFENGFLAKDNIQLIDELSKTLTEQPKGGDEEKVRTQMKEYVENWIGNALKSKNVFLDTHTKNNLAQNLIDSIYQKTYPEDSKYVESIRGWLKDIPELSNFLNEKILVENLAKKLYDLQKAGSGEEAIFEAVVDWINNLCKKHGLNIDPKVVRLFAEKLMDTLKLRKRKPIKLAENFQETIAEELSHILDDDAITLNNKVKRNLQNKMTNIVSNNIENLLSNETAKAKNDLIKLIRHEGNMSLEEAKDLATTVIEATKIMPLTDESKKLAKSMPYQSKKGPGVKEELASTSDETNVANKAEMAGTMSDILPDETIRGKKAHRMKNETYPFFEESSARDDQFDGKERILQMSLPPDDKSSIEKRRQSSIPSSTSSQLANKRLAPSFKTSTPRKDYSIHPRRLTFDSSIPSDYFEDKSKQLKSLESEEDKYTKNLSRIVKNWLDKMPISLNDEDSTRFKDIVINDLVGDMTDRQKYLQLNPGSITSDTEELENLKYQIFRWLNKVMNANDIEVMLPQTEVLMNAIRSISVPQLTIPSGVRKDEKRAQGTVPHYLDALQDEISLWVDKIPKHLHQSTDKKYHERMINELAKKLQHVENKDIAYEIQKWLQKYFKYASQDEINKVANDLKNKLARKGFSKDASRVIEQDSGEFIEENLHGGILDWLKGSPYYQSANIEDRITQEKVIAGMAKGIKNVFENAFTTSQDLDPNEFFLDEIAKHLKMFPIDSDKIFDEGFSKNIAANLLQYLKGLQIFQNITGRQSAMAHDYLSNSVDRWVESLPIVDPQSMNNIQFQVLIDQFKEKLNHLKDVGDVKDIKEEIKKELKMLPIDPLKLNNEKFMNEKVDQLLQKIIQSQPNRLSDILYNVDSSFGSKHSSRGAADILHENVSAFCESLPIQKGKLSEECEKTLKHNIASKVMNIIGELNMNPEVLKDDFLYKHILEDELDNLVTGLPLDAAAKVSINHLKNNLINKIEEAKESAKNVMAGHIYKQQLRDTISKTLPPSEDLSVDEEASLELLKENVADAFINLHFYGANGEVKDKYKNKIKKEISKFCNDYLKRHPLTPIDREKLNEELYTALNNVSFSSGNAVRDEVQETTIKDLIVDCANELPLSQDTGAEELQAYKIISLMSKRIHKLEKDKEFIENYENVLTDEIVKWSKKLPLKHWQENNINDFANKLVEKLKQTESSRRFDSSKMDTLDFNLTSGSVAPNQASREQSKIPPSTLSQQDCDHLQQIRERSVSGKRRIISPVRKDAAISPAPIDIGSQTEVRPWREKSIVQKSPSIQAATQVEPQVCLSPTCDIRRQRPCLQSEREFCHILQEQCNKHGRSMQGQKERLLPCEIDHSESGNRDFKSPSCECQPKFIPYQLSSGQSSAMSRSCMPQPHVVPNVYRPTQYNLPEDTLPTPKRPKRKAQSPPRREERPRKTIRSQSSRLGEQEGGQGSSKIAEKQNNKFEYLPEAKLCGSYVRREVLISDDEFEPHDSKENPKCRCKGRGSAGGHVRERGPCKEECIKRCPKCCGVHCPHPTYMFFKK